MKFITRVAFILFFGFWLSGVLPWWVLIVIAFIVGFLVYGHGIGMFLSGFLGGGLLWLGYAWHLDNISNSFLSNKIVDLFPVRDPFFLIVLSGFIGAFSGGLGSITGNSLRQMFTKKQAGAYYS